MTLRNAAGFATNIARNFIHRSSHSLRANALPSSDMSASPVRVRISHMVLCTYCSANGNLFPTSMIFNNAACRVAPSALTDTIAKEVTSPRSVPHVSRQGFGSLIAQRCSSSVSLFEAFLSSTIHPDHSPILKLTFGGRITGLRRTPHLKPYVRDLVICGPDNVRKCLLSNAGVATSTPVLCACDVSELLRLLPNVRSLTIHGVLWTRCILHENLECWDGVGPRVFHSVTLCDIQHLSTHDSALSCIKPASSISTLTITDLHGVHTPLVPGNLCAVQNLIASEPTSPTPFAWLGYPRFAPNTLRTLSLRLRGWCDATLVRNIIADQTLSLEVLDLCVFVPSDDSWGDIGLNRCTQLRTFNYAYDIRVLPHSAHASTQRSLLDVMARVPPSVHHIALVINIPDITLVKPLCILTEHNWEQLGRTIAHVGSLRALRITFRMNYKAPHTSPCMLPWAGDDDHYVRAHLAQLINRTVPITLDICEGTYFPSA
ncbi:hypothetical protein NM688_g8657 [Phlebia brevispora]|uniref:Uncharacterized protein n=1 Tax=Phlebia brevispora TaxID=194682 RepID=A0ACC1RQF9_9APHY|nr:hypothetical protein NM688_g8657 [Phlebia brevispora]